MKKLYVGITALAMSFALAAPASAVVVNVGGVNWDTDATPDFTSTSGNIFQSFGDDGMGNTTVSGFGRVNFINGADQNTFCPGCELTFAYDGYTSVAGFDPNTAGAFEFDGGQLTVYVDDMPDFDSVNPQLAQATDGDTWLTMEGANIFGSEPNILNDGTTLRVTLGGAGATGIGNLDVTGGLAAAFFDTNTTFGGSDFEFQTSFTEGSDFTLGSGNLSGDSQAVPEPAVLGLLGLGLLGMGAVSGRRRNRDRV